MRNRRKLFVLLAAVMVAGGALLWFTREKEPSYEGRTLSKWITIYHVEDSFGSPAFASPARQQSVDAIRHIGTNALPWLLSWIDYEPEVRRNMIARMVANLPKKLRFDSLVVLFSRDQAEEQAYKAKDVFAALGSIAEPSIPELKRRATLTNSPGKTTLALIALAGIGVEGARATTSILSRPIWVNSDWPIQCISDMGTNARPLVPLIVQRLQSTNASVAYQSTVMLRMLRVDPDLVVPALAKSLNDPRFLVQCQAAETLGKFGELARPALPALTNALSDPIFSVRDHASNSIWKITTAPGTNAPPR